MRTSWTEKSHHIFKTKCAKRWTAAAHRQRQCDETRTMRLAKWYSRIRNGIERKRRCKRKMCSQSNSFCGSFAIQITCRATNLLCAFFYFRSKEKVLVANRLREKYDFENCSTFLSDKKIANGALFSAIVATVFGRAENVEEIFKKIFANFVSPAQFFTNFRHVTQRSRWNGNFVSMARDEWSDTFNGLPLMRSVCTTDVC